MLYTCDFETTTSLDDCRVWCWGLCSIHDINDFTYGYTIDELMSWIMSNQCSKLYFHNLKFDGEFIIDWLFRNGFKHITKKEDRKDKTFETLISDKGLFYSLKINFIYRNDPKKKYTERKSVTVLDSLKMLPMSVSKIAKTFGVEENKLEIDYKKYRPLGYRMKPEEVMYLRNDCVIVAKAVKMIFEIGHTKMTQGSNALQDYKNRLDKFEFEKFFPTPSYEVDKDIRQSYRGGWTYCKKSLKDKEIGEGLVLDVNSLYPYVMRHKPLPYGLPVFFKGKYKKDNLYPLYVQMISCQFKIKEGYLPTIQIKDRNSIFRWNEYLESSYNEKLGFLQEVTLCLTNLDLELFLEHYEVFNLEYISGWKFKSRNGLFDEYIDYWSEQKINAKKENNKGMYMYSKLMLNALYGKFALNPNVRSKIPYFDYEEDKIRYEYGEKEVRKSLYIPLGSYVTSWARYITISTAQSVYDRFVYADTDSIHLIGKELPDNIEIDDSKLGAWKLEYEFDKAKYLRAKCYIDVYSEEWKPDKEDKNGNKVYDGFGNIVKEDMHITVAGMPDSCYDQVTFENFKFGSVFTGKLQMKHVSGGIVLIDTTYEIKP